MGPNPVFTEAIDDYFVDQSLFIGLRRPNASQLSGAKSPLEVLYANLSMLTRGCNTRKAYERFVQRCPSWLKSRF